MVRTLTGMAKPEPEPKPHAAGAAQDSTPSTVRFATLPNAPQWCVAGAPLAISIRNRSERMATRHASVGKNISMDTPSR